MWDQSTGKSRGFGFVAFRERADAEQAIATMNGEWLGSRAIRCNWANQKNPGLAAGVAMNNQFCMYPQQLRPLANVYIDMFQMNLTVPSAAMSYEHIFAQTSPYHTTVYIGNLPHGTTRMWKTSNENFEKGSCDSCVYVFNRRARSCAVLSTIWLRFRHSCTK